MQQQSQVIGIDGRTLAYEDSLFRGIGQYTLHLLQALAHLRPTWRFRVFLQGEPFLPSGADALAECPNLELRTWSRLGEEPLDHWLIPDLLNACQGFNDPLKVAPVGVPRSVIFYDLIPLIFRSQHLDQWAPPLQAEYLDRLEALRHDSARVLAISESTRRDLHRRLHMPLERSVNLRAGLNAPAEPPTEAQVEATLKRLGVRRPFVMTTGNLDPHKRFDTTIYAFTLASREVPLQLVVTGSLTDGAKRTYKEGFEKTGVQNLLFTDFISREDLACLYRAATALAFPSIYEGFGLPVLEAMAGGCPVITTRASSLPEVAGDAALLIEPGDHETMAAHMVRLVKEPALRQRHAALGHRQARGFTWEAVAQRTLEAWDAPAQPEAGIAIAIFRAAGDILNCTPLARQLKADHPDTRLTWITAERYAFLLEGNPYVDEILALPGDPAALDGELEALRASRPWSRFITPAPYLNYDAAPGRSLIDIIRAASGLTFTLPWKSVMRLSADEIASARAWWNALPGGPRILMETEFLSRQSAWDAETIFEVLDVLGDLDPLLVLSSRTRPPFMDALLARHPRAVWCDLPFRLNAELYNLADAFLGVSSGLSNLTLTDHCREDVPSLEYCLGEHWSGATTWGARARIYAYGRERFLEGLEWLKARLSGTTPAPDFTPRPLPGTCPACGRDHAAPWFDAENQLQPVPEGEGDAPMLRCRSCGLVQPGRGQAAETDGTPEDPMPFLAEQLARLGTPRGLLVEAEAGDGTFLRRARLSGWTVRGFGAAPGQDPDLDPTPFPQADLPAGSAAAVVLRRGFDRLGDPMAWIHKAAHLLTEDGLLLLQVPHQGAHWQATHPDLGHSYRYSWHAARALVLQAGFEILDCATPSRGGHGQELRQALRAKYPQATEGARINLLLAQDAVSQGEALVLVARRRGLFQGRLATDRVRASLPAPSPEPRPTRIIYVRTDAIGDGLLSAAMLPHLMEGLAPARITVVCQAHLAGLYEACPHVADVIGYDRTRAYEEEGYRQAISDRIRQVRADLCLHPVYSREVLGDLWAMASGAPRRLGHAGDCHNMTAEQHQAMDPVYTQLLPSGESHDLELDRHRSFLEALGIQAPPLQPLVWTLPEDAAWAQDLFARHALEADRTLSVFLGSKDPNRMYPHMAAALRPLCEAGWRLVAMGSEGERGLCEDLLRALPGSHVNACGCTVRQSAEVMKRSRLAVGPESGLLHLACAVGIPNVVVLGGAFFGRFLPYSPLTTAAVLPLDCYLCDTHCPYPRPHCLHDIYASVVTRALETALAPATGRMRLVAQTDWRQPEGGPNVIDLAPALDASRVDILEVPGPAPAPPAVPAPTMPAAPQAPTAPRTTVFCAVWHKDPDRFRLLEGHQASLDAQSVPVERLYIFDGDDTPPAWLKGNVVTTRAGLGIYEAWDLAVTLTRTPFVMNLNLDDRLNRQGVEVLERVLDSGADLVGGDWQICFSQGETDALAHCQESSVIPFHPQWPPEPGITVRLGSGTGERGTFGPACLWRVALHGELGRYPWRFQDGTQIRSIGDSVWWRLLMQAGKVLKRVPILIGRYHSHPGDQAEFRNPGADEEARLEQVGLHR